MTEENGAKKTRNKLESLNRQRDEILARIRAQKSKEASERRKVETRQKIILGGRLLALSKTDDRARVLLEVLMKDLSANEKSVFAQIHEPE